MRHFNRLSPLFSILFIMLLPANLKSQLTIDAELRPRFEFRNGYQRLAPENANPAAFVTQRTRFSFRYENEALKLHFSPQDVRPWGGGAWGDLGGFYTNTAYSLDIFEGYAEINIGANNWISVGRQRLIYDNQWMLSGRNWNQRAIASDAVVLKINREDWRLHIATSWNSNVEPRHNHYYPTNRYKTLNFVWYNRKLTDEINLSLLNLLTGQTENPASNKIYFRNTTGAYINYRGSTLFGHTNIYYQYGKSQEGLPVRASLVAGEVGLISDLITPGAGIVLYSGNDRSGVDKSRENLFDKAHSPRHAIFGNIDYFTDIREHTAEGGLINSYLWFRIDLSENLSVRNTGHFFWLHKLNPSTPDKKHLGFENDLIVSWKFREWGDLESGLLFFSPTEALRQLQNVPDNRLSHFFYIQMTLKPELFRSER